MCNPMAELRYSYNETCLAAKKLELTKKNDDFGLKGAPSLGKYINNNSRRSVALRTPLVSRTHYNSWNILQEHPSRRRVYRVVPSLS